VTEALAEAATTVPCCCTTLGFGMPALCNPTSLRRLLSGGKLVAGVAAGGWPAGGEVDVAGGGGDSSLDGLMYGVDAAKCACLSLSMDSDRVGIVVEEERLPRRPNQFSSQPVPLTVFALVSGGTVVVVDVVEPPMVALTAGVALGAAEPAGRNSSGMPEEDLSQGPAIEFLRPMEGVSSDWSSIAREWGSSA